MNLWMPLARSFSRSPESVSEACEVAITSGPLPVNSKAVFMERLLDELHDGKQWYDHSICLFYQNHHRGPSPKRWPPPGRHHPPPDIKQTSRSPAFNRVFSFIRIGCILKSCL